MNTWNRNIAITTAVLAISLATASAQMVNVQLTASVPFSFAAGSQIFPAGEYRIPVSYGQVVRITNADDHQTKFAGFATNLEGKFGEQPRLVFLCRGDHCVLQEIRTGRMVGYQFPAPKWSKSEDAELTKPVVLSAKLATAN